MTPVLWTFRRCPYAMRARLAVSSSGIQTELREILLRDKPEAFLNASPTASVPCLEAKDTLDESLDIMHWALRQSDPEHLLAMPNEGHALIAQNDSPFKTALDHYKYPTRYEGIEPLTERTKASTFIEQLNTQLNKTAWLFGRTPTLADFAILPFIRQFAHVDLPWFESQPWPHAQRWLSDFKASSRFATIMHKYPAWQPGDTPTIFP